MESRYNGTPKSEMPTGTPSTITQKTGTSPVHRPSTGILNYDIGRSKFQINRYAPSEALSFYVQRYWIVRWDLTGQEPYDQYNIPHPCVNLVFERGKTAIFGIAKGKSRHRLQDAGEVFGVKFKPGAFYPWWGQPVSNVTGGVLPFQDVFGMDSVELENAIFGTEEVERKIQIVEDFLRAKQPAEQDQHVEEIQRMIDVMIWDRSLKKVDELAARFGMSIRTIQRLFDVYVGLRPKWVIQLYRLHDAVGRMAKGQPLEWKDVALDLGYYDQAHFNKAFKSLVGQSPDEYVRSLG